MKSAFVIAAILGLTASSALADEANLVALKGTVVKTNEFRGFKEFSILNPELVSSSANLPRKKVLELVNGKFGFSAMTQPSSALNVSNCKEAVLIIAAGKGNVLPNDGGEETYRPPEIVAFTCINN